MPSRRAKTVGGVVAVAAAVLGLMVHFLVEDLDEADKLASAIGLFLGLSGLGLAVYGWFTDRAALAQGAEASAGSADHGSAAAAPAGEPGGGGVRNDISGGMSHAPAIQSSSVGPVSLAPGSPQASLTPQTPAAQSRDARSDERVSGTGWVVNTVSNTVASDLIYEQAFAVDA